MQPAVVFTSEADFRGWFEKNLERFGVKRIILSQGPCPSDEWPKVGAGIR